MENIKINVSGIDFEFNSEIKMKHLRAVEPLLHKLQDKTIGNIDVMVEIAKALLVNSTPSVLEDKLNDLDLDGFAKFSKDFEVILQNFNKLSEDKKK